MYVMFHHISIMGWMPQMSPAHCGPVTSSPWQGMAAGERFNTGKELAPIIVSTAIRTNHRRLGAAAIALGFVSLVVLRFWVSPIARRATGREAVGVAEFLGIPLFLGLVVLGIALLLWEPGEQA